MDDKEDIHDHKVSSAASDESSVQDFCHSRMDTKTIKKHLIICSVAFMMNYSAYGGLVFLQSSMNIENGLGTASLFAIYATSSLSTIFFVPIFVDFLGAKMAIVTGEIGIAAFTLANFYPTWFTMIPVAIFHGLTESASWTGAAVYVTYLGEQFWECKCNSKNQTKPNKDQDSYVYKFFSVFLVFVYFAQVIGNGLVSLVLSGSQNFGFERAINNTSVFQLDSTVTKAFNTNFSLPNVTMPPTGNTVDNLWNYCGAQECQSEYIYDEESEILNKYEPNQQSVYLLLGLFLSMQIIFTSVHFFGLPAIPAKLDTYQEENKAIMSNRDDEAFVKKTSPRSARIRKAICLELKETCLHFISPLHLLVFPLLFYYGVMLAFNVTEFTRAYVSCSIGVEQVGWVMVIYGFSSMLISLAATKMLPYFGRNVIMCFMLVIHLSTFLLCLFWQPSYDARWVVFLISFCLGCCDGVLSNVMQGMVAIYFQNKLGIAFSVKNFANNLGIVASTGISTSLCIYVKIYILIGLLAISFLSYIGAEFVFRRTKRRSV